MHFLKHFVTFFFVFVFCFCYEQQTCQIWVGHNFVQYEIWNLIFGWTRYKTEHRVEEVCCTKCFIVSVMSFHVYFDKQVHKKLGKKLSKQKKKSFKAWILLAQTYTEKQMRAAALRHTIYFFSLMFTWFVFEHSQSVLDRGKYSIRIHF